MTIHKDALEKYRKELMGLRFRDLIVEASKVWGLSRREVQALVEHELIETCVACFENELAGGGQRRVGARSIPVEGS